MLQLFLEECPCATNNPLVCRISDELLTHVCGFTASLEGRGLVSFPRIVTLHTISFFSLGRHLYSLWDTMADSITDLNCRASLYILKWLPVSTLCDLEHQHELLSKLEFLQMLFNTALHLWPFAARYLMQMILDLNFFYIFHSFKITLIRIWRLKPRLNAQGTKLHRLTFLETVLVTKYH